MARSDAKIQSLAKVQLFSEFSQKDLVQIAKVSDEARYEAGRVVVDQGDAGLEFHVILEGTAKVTRNGRKVTTLGPGQYFGELALLDRGPRSASVVAETDLTTLVIGHRAFSGVLDQVPALARKLLGAMAQRLRAADLKASTH